jgi:dienelactone hydrolase
VETVDPGEPYPVETEPVEDDSGYPAPVEAECVFEDAAPQRHELTAEDGTALVGTFYPAAACDAPLVILYHQFGSHKDSWTDLALWMQNRGAETAYSGKYLAAPIAQYTWFPEFPSDLSLAVFAPDFRDHGESQETNSGLDGPGFLMDAQAALDYAKTLPNVDPARVIIIGASIGADASVDVCLTLSGNQPAADQVDEGCIGAMPLSPGSYLGPMYEEVVTRLADPPFNIHIHCIASALDGPSPDLCEAELPGSVDFTVYPGRSEHGMAMLREEMDPDIGVIIHGFMLKVLGLDGG